MLKYEIAGISIGIHSIDLKALDGLTAFSSSLLKSNHMEITLKSCESIEMPEGKLLLNEGFPWIKNSINGNISVCIYGKEANQIAYMLDVDKTWRNASIYYLKNTPDIEYSISGALGEILFRNHILFHQGIVLHASAIDWNGKGIMFSAPSETGKSTQAALWKEYMGATVLNGDRPAIKMVNKFPYVYGTPWSGSSQEYMNSYAPLAAIVMLEQSPINSIQPLTGVQAVSKLMPRAFLPYYNSELMQLAISNLEEIIKTTPIYLLKCRPDRESVELLYKLIK